MGVTTPFGHSSIDAGHIGTCVGLNTVTWGEYLAFSNGSWPESWARGVGHCTLLTGNVYW